MIPMTKIPRKTNNQCFLDKYRQFLKLTHTILSALSQSLLKLTDNLEWIPDCELWSEETLGQGRSGLVALLFSLSLVSSSSPPTYQPFLDNVSLFSAIWKCRYILQKILYPTNTQQGCSHLVYNSKIIILHSKSIADYLILMGCSNLIY